MVLNFLHWAFVIVLGLIGAYLAILGGGLVYLGGSPYYLLAGILTLVVTVFAIKREVRAPRLFAVVLAITLVWAIYESGLDFLALLPRIAAWLVIGAWFLTPWFRATLTRYGNGDVPGYRSWIAGASIASLLVLTIASLQGYTQNATGTVREVVEDSPIHDWRQYGNTDGGTRFAEIDQINTETVGHLKEVWRYRTGIEGVFKMSPLQVDGLLYLCGAANILMALDDDTGEELWRYDPKVQLTDDHEWAKTCRGISYHEAPQGYDGQCPKRIVSATVDARLFTVDAKTGRLCDDFGDDGFVDLREGLGPHVANEYYVTSPALVADDVLVVGALVLDSQDLGLPSGVVRAYDALDGSFAWAWDLGNPGYNGEPAEGEEYTRGTPNVWSIMSYDAELDLVYAPTGNAGPDYYGGERRPFDDEFSSAVVALDAESGAVRWKFQTVHHDIWDYDAPAQPVLVDVSRDGQDIPSVAVPIKTGEIFLLDRRDGSPVYPIEEKPAPQDPAEGEYLSPTQPESPLPNFRPYRHEKDMWGLTPLDHLLCRIEYRILRYEGLFTPPTQEGSFQYPGNFGGFNWGSVSVDADHGLLVAAPMMLGNRVMLVTPEQVAEAGPRAALLLGENHPAVRMDPDSPMPEARDPDPDDPFDHVRIRYYGLTLPFMSRAGTEVPCLEPPWSRIGVIDLNTNELLWSRPLGSMKDSGPFGIRSGLPFQVGTPVRAGTLTTRGGLTFMSSTMDKTVRAFDVRTGKVLWSEELPGSGQATPITYLSQDTNRQYLIVTVPNPSWRYPRDSKTGTYEDSSSITDGKGGYVIAYALQSK